MTGPLKVHGGKHYLAPRIVALMPAHTHYVEPYAGGLSVLLAKPCDGISEAVNDIDGDLTTFWRVLQDVKAFARFRRRVQAIPFSEAEWEKARARLGRPSGLKTQAERVERAVRFFVTCRQSMAGRCKDFAPLTRNRTRRGMNEQASAWLNAVDGLPAVHARLRRVVILNRPALEVIRSQDGPESLFYLDPPYVPETRASQEAFGGHDMTAGDHEELLGTLVGLKGMVMLSGYRCALYDKRLSGWDCHEFDLPNHAAGGILKRRVTEAVWCNFRLASRPMEAA